MCSAVLVQSDLTYKGPPRLRSLWIEVPPYCHLNCAYCFANSGPTVPDVSGALAVEDYSTRIIEPFEQLGGQWLGIPGAGEPFDRRNIFLTKRIVELSGARGLGELTIFTSGDLIDEETARYLAENTHVKVMVKWNSSNPAIQDRLVGDSSGRYTERRERGWQLLLSAFKGDRARLGIVTSVLAENWTELPELLRRARGEGVVFDCDTLLPKGRGRHCEQTPTPEVVRTAVRRLQKVDEEHATTWASAGAYIATPCTRYLHHLYVDFRGTVYPCVGMSCHPLGNVKATSLDEIWRSPRRQALVQRIVVGACANCERFANKACTSCFGRSLSGDLKGDKLNLALDAGWMPTRPCPLFAPDFSVAVHVAGMTIRTVLANPRVVDEYLEESLENLWNPCLLISRNGQTAVPDSPGSGGPLISDLVEPSARASDEELAGWFREQGLDVLLSDISPLTILWRADNGFRRLIVLPEGYPVFQEIAETEVKLWVLTDVTLARLVGTTVAQRVEARLQGAVPPDGEVAVSHDLAFLLSRCHDNEEGEYPTSRVKMDGRWTIVQLRDPEPLTDHGAAPAPNPAGEERNPKTVLRFRMLNIRSGRTIDMSAAWVKKQMDAKCVPYAWSDFFDRRSGEVRSPTAAVTVDDAFVGSLLPRLLVPMTTLALDRHLNKPSWILWLFYDPCRNAYFRRLLDCRESPAHPGDSVALRLLYLWPESSAHIERMLSAQGGGQEIQWFDKHILNLSDVLRDPIVDYELVLDDDLGRNRGFPSIRFSVAKSLTSVASYSDSLLTVARSPGLSAEEMHILETQPFVDAPADRTPLYKKLAVCLGRMANTLLPSKPTTPDNTADRIEALYEELPDELTDAIQGSTFGRMSSADQAECRRRTVNYFIWLGALRQLGIRYYYVGQTLTHNVVPLVPRTREAREDWNITPSGFIVASNGFISDRALADVRLVYATVMAPLIEQYAKWTSDYEIERCRVVRKNMPCLHRLPKHYLRQLECEYLWPDLNRISDSCPDAVRPEGWEKHQKRDLEWLRRVPKADLHVHLGPAIPPDVLFDLSLLSLYRWYSYGPDEGTGSGGAEAVRVFGNILRSAVTTAVADSPQDWTTTDKFRDTVIQSARHELNVDTVLSINSLIAKVANKCHLGRNQCACIFNVVLGRLMRANVETWRPSIERRIARLREFATYLEELREARDDVNSERTLVAKARAVVASAYLVPHSHVIDGALRNYVHSSVNVESILNEIDEALRTLGFNETVPAIEWNAATWGDPLSNLLSIPRQVEREASGLGRYIDRTDMTGSSVLQFCETLVLAVIESAIHAAKSDSVRYLELRFSPQGLLLEPQPDIEDVAISVALLGLAYVTDRAARRLEGEKRLFWLSEGTDWPYILTNVIIAGKRYGDRESLRQTVQYAVDSRDRYLSACARLSPSSDEPRARARLPARGGKPELQVDGTDLLGTGPGLIVPRVVGVDLVGRERGVRHAELGKSMMEAFEKCVLLTIHAGEDEDVRNVWEAVFALHAQRIGHGLRMHTSNDLLNLIRDRRIPVELCPASNQFTNGFRFDYDDYVFEKYRNNHVTLTINTDNPWISHRWPTGGQRYPYPLSEEFLILPLLFRNSAPRDSDGFREFPYGVVTRLDVLRLVFQGFDNAFLPAPDRDALLALADLETFLVIRRHDLKYQPVGAVEQ
jgi:radical SAM protein with 4Fe4S-binding SPASM domain